MLAGWVLALLAGLLAGLGAAAAVEADADRRRAESRAVSAVLAENAEGEVLARVGSDQRVWATVRWTAPDGSTRTDEVRVVPGTPAGDRVTVWTDRSGALTAAPVGAGEARLHAALLGVLASASVGGVVLGAAWLVRARLDRRRMEQWDAEWERIDTRWGRKTG